MWVWLVHIPGVWCATHGGMAPSTVGGAQRMCEGAVTMVPPSLVVLGVVRSPRVPPFLHQWAAVMYL